MKKMNRKSVSAILTLVLALSVSLTACSKGSQSGNETKDAPAANATKNQSTSENTQASEEVSPFKEHMDISVAYWEIGSAFQNPENDEVLKKLQEKLNITIKPVQIGWSDYSEKIKVWAASGELPDIFTTNLPDVDMQLYLSWAKQGIVRALPDDMSKFPNIAPYLDSPDVQALKVDGKFYTYPRYNYPNIDGWMPDRAILVRKDWMEKLGLKDPQNFGEFKALLKAFVTQDPNGNGKQDEIGLEGHGAMSHYLDFAFTSTLPQAATNYWVKENDKWIPHYMSAKFPKMLEQWRSLYQEGLLDKDFSIYKNDEGTDVFTQGRSGALVFSVSPGHLKSLSDKWTQYNPNSKFSDNVKMLPLWPDDQGKRYHFVMPTYWSESYFSAQVDDKKMERIMYLYDYLASPEGSRLTRYGIEGVDYKLEGDQPVSLLKEGEELSKKYPSAGALSFLVSWASDTEQVDTPANRAKFGDDIFNLFQDSVEWMKDNTEAIPVNFDIQSIALLEPKVNGFTVNEVDEDILKTVIGKGDIATTWQQTLKNYEKLGLTKIIEDVNKQALEKGIQ